MRDIAAIQPGSHSKHRLSRHGPRPDIVPVARTPSLAPPPARPLPRGGAASVTRPVLPRVGPDPMGHERLTPVWVHPLFAAWTLPSYGASAGHRLVAFFRHGSLGRPLPTSPLHAIEMGRHRRRSFPRSQPPRRGSARDRPCRRDDYPACRRLHVYSPARETRDEA